MSNPAYKVKIIVIVKTGKIVSSRAGFVPNIRAVYYITGQSEPAFWGQPEAHFWAKEASPKRVGPTQL